jgi:hypothetical protein
MENFLVKRWSVLRASIYGAMVGLVYSLAKLFFGDPVQPLIDVRIAFLIGGTLGGTFLFAAIAAIKNAVLR